MKLLTKVFKVTDYNKNVFYPDLATIYTVEKFTHYLNQYRRNDLYQLIAPDGYLMVEEPELKRLYSEYN